MRELEIESEKERRREGEKRLERVREMFRVEED